jgi:hypothetical protein
MKPFFKKLFSIPFYPILFSAYPVLALLSANIGQVKVNDGIRPLIVSVVSASILFLLLRVIFRNWHKTAFFLTLFLLLFFAYGHAYMALAIELKDINIMPWMLSAFGILLLGALIWSIKVTPSAAALNAITLGLVLVSLSQTSFGDARSVHALGSPNAPVEENLVKPQNPPDVYYFILDSYGRADLLNQAYKYDNSDFIEQLKDRGFNVPACSQSNYVRTEISLGSSLNMQYLQDLNDEFSPDNTKRRILWDSLKHSAVRYNFESMGYKTVGFATGFDWNELHDADHFITPPPISSGLSEFEGLLIRTTLARHTQDLGWFDPDYIMGVNFRDRFLNVFNNMDDIARNPEPTFSYIHLISPHPPFVFDPEGNPTYPPDFWNENREYPPSLYQQGYVNQLQYLNKKMLEAIDTILENSTTPPIIIIQGDHGPWMQPKAKRFWILNAYYLPEHNDAPYKTISPVNTFRMVFNLYFGGQYDMLDDVSYFSPVPKLYEFSKVPYPCDIQ